MNNSFPYWKFQCGRWLAGKIASFDLEGQGLFLQFCMAAWEGHGVFNICSTSLAMRFRKGKEWINDTVTAMIEIGILRKEDDKYRIKFIDEQLNELIDIRYKRSKAGKISAETRMHSKETPLASPEKEIKIKEEKSIEEKSSVLNMCSTDVEFETFWHEYPHKVGKGNAKKAWKKHGCNKIVAKIMQTLALYKKSEQWTKDNGQFIPHPATWLNAGSWDDEPNATQKKPITPIIHDIKPKTLSNADMEAMDFYEEQLKLFKSTGNEGEIPNLYRKIRDNFGQEGIAEIQKRMKCPQ